MTDLYIVATMTVRAEDAPRAKALLEPATEAFRKEDGCLGYTLLADRKSPGRFVTFERWRDEVALAAHMKSPTMAALSPSLKALLAEPMTQDFLSALRIL